MYIDSSTDDIRGDTVQPSPPTGLSESDNFYNNDIIHVLSFIPIMTSLVEG
jgi:hypothetical protein